MFDDKAVLINVGTGVDWLLFAIIDGKPLIAEHIKTIKGEQYIEGFHSKVVETDGKKVCKVVMVVDNKHENDDWMTWTNNITLDSKMDQFQDLADSLFASIQSGTKSVVQWERENFQKMKAAVLQ